MDSWRILFLASWYSCSGKEAGNISLTVKEKKKKKTSEKQTGQSQRSEMKWKKIVRGPLKIMSLDTS